MLERKEGKCGRPEILATAVILGGDGKAFRCWFSSVVTSGGSPQRFPMESSDDSSAPTSAL
ncbi:hypothetical protein HanRHA438_Chr14g0663671 [Helianthus annuus]|nr:hypothetical protein HanRHA438_Chr14g0663671 [Helianthus annuus]